MRAGCLSAADIRRLLLHRPPFLFLDGAIENVICERVVAFYDSWTKRRRLARLELLEAMGQAGALVLRQVSTKALILF